MSNAPSNQDHDPQPSASTVEGSPGGEANDLVQSVLEDARAVLGAFEDEPRESGSTNTVPESPSSAPTPFDSDAVETVLDRVEGLVDDLDRVGVAVEQVPRPETMDLTAAVPPPPVSPDEQVPDHGPNGPEVDLFAVEATSSPSLQPMANPTLDFQRVDPMVDEAPGRESLEPMTENPDGRDPEEAPDDEASVRLERLLANRLAEEYDSVEELKQRKSNVQDSDPITEDGSQSVSAPDLDAEDEAGGLSDLESIKTTDNEIGISSTRVVSAVESEPVEMTSVSDEGEAPEPTPMESLPDDVEDSPVSGMVRAAEEDADERPVDASAEVASSASVEADEPQAGPEAVSVSTTEVAESTNPGSLEDEVDFAPEVTLVENRESFLKVIGALPYRYLPKSLHPFMTPLALSLAIWVPVAWSFAILDPTPAPADSTVLRPGFMDQPDQVEIGPADGEISSVPAIETH